MTVLQIHHLEILEKSTRLTAVVQNFDLRMVLCDAT